MDRGHFRGRPIEHFASGQRFIPVRPSCLPAGAPRKLSIRGENAYTATIFEWYHPRRSSGPGISELHDYDKEPLVAGLIASS